MRVPGAFVGAVCLALVLEPGARAGGREFDQSRAEAALDAGGLVGIWSCVGSYAGKPVNATMRWYHLEDGTFWNTLHPTHPDASDPAHATIVEQWRWDAEPDASRWLTEPDPSSSDQAAFSSLGRNGRTMTWLRQAAQSTMSRTFEFQPRTSCASRSTTAGRARRRWSSTRSPASARYATSRLRRDLSHRLHASFSRRPYAPADMSSRDVPAFAMSLLALLVAGDFASTFFYHVPQHIWGKLHLRTHHDNRRSYWDHAIVSRDPAILLDGFLGAVPYFAIAALLASLGRAAALGALAGLVLGHLHVLWRHTCEIGWVSPPWLVRFARATGLVLPEDHNGHHKDPNVEFGDLFRFYDPPARALLSAARGRRRAYRRLERIRAFRATRVSGRQSS
jgi:hypothetical protein